MQFHLYIYINLYIYEYVVMRVPRSSVLFGREFFRDRSFSFEKCYCIDRHFSYSVPLTNFCYPQEIRGFSGDFKSQKDFVNRVQGPLRDAPSVHPRVGPQSVVSAVFDPGVGFDEVDSFVSGYLGFVLTTPQSVRGLVSRSLWFT